MATSDHHLPAFDESEDLSSPPPGKQPDPESPGESGRALSGDAGRIAAEPYRLAEYEAMRATIRQRGTARMVLVPAALAGWAALTIGAAAVITVALSTLIPLLVLVAAFESVFALHVNVERIGRYLQVFHERAHAGWST